MSMNSRRRQYEAWSGTTVADFFADSLNILNIARKLSRALFVIESLFNDRIPFTTSFRASIESSLVTGASTIRFPWSSRFHPWEKLICARIKLRTFFVCYDCRSHCPGDPVLWGELLANRHNEITRSWRDPFSF